MPELPEVETIRLGLERYIIGQKVKSIDISWARSMLCALSLIEDHVIGGSITAVERKAKVLIISLGSGYSLLCHLKMTGQLVLVRPGGDRFTGGHPTPSMVGALPDRSTRVVIEFESGDRLFFNDQRKFGWIKLVPTNEVELDSFIARLGPEPLSAQFTLDRFAVEVRRHAKAPIKAIILDQSTVSGVGNIYADESLHLARVHPARRGGSLKLAEIKRLHQAIKEVMVLGIKHGGTSFTSYVNALGQQGDYLQHARVFRRQGLPCGVCGTVIEKIRIAGRGTHVCPRCQKGPLVSVGA
jgi:formamidopyrimidine-DNA glycosylase